MSLPAPVSGGLTVATFRAGLARGLGAAVPAVRLWLGQAPPGQYRSPFPARLRIARLALVVLAFAWLAAGLSGLNATSGIVRTVGHDTAPSVSAAQAIRTGLAAANADYALAMVSSEGADGAFLSAMRLHLRAVQAAVVEAAGNVTYGDEERGPIGTVLQGLGEYEQLVGRSVASQGYARRDLAYAADDVLHGTVLPAAVTLERVNADHLAEDYRDYGRRHVLAWVVVTTALVVLVLFAAQVDMARRAKRLLNPGLLVATLAVLAATALLTTRLLAAQSDLRIAKQDAFDSIYAIATARALGADADAAQSFEIVALRDPSRSDRYRDAVASSSARLLGADSQAAVRDAEDGKPVKGYLGEELSNATFPGEAEAALAVISAWGTVLKSDATLRSALAGGDQILAVGMKTANVPTSARTSFDRLDAALVKVLAINETAFAASIASAEGDDAPLGAVLVAGFVLAVAAAWFGIGRRLDEYRF